MPIENGHGRRHVTALKMGQLPIFNLHGSKVRKLTVSLFLSLDGTTVATSCFTEIAPIAKQSKLFH